MKGEDALPPRGMNNKAPEKFGKAKAEFIKASGIGSLENLENLISILLMHGIWSPVLSWVGRAGKSPCGLEDGRKLGSEEAPIIASSIVIHVMRGQPSLAADILDRHQFGDGR